MLLATINSSILLIDTDACAELLAAATTAFSAPASRDG
jgi:hypothetical protein